MKELWLLRLPHNRALHPCRALVRHGPLALVALRDLDDSRKEWVGQERLEVEELILADCAAA